MKKLFLYCLLFIVLFSADLAAQNSKMKPSNNVSHQDSLKKTLVELNHSEKHKVLQYAHQLKQDVDQQIIAEYNMLTEEQKKYLTAYAKSLTETEKEKQLTTISWDSDTFEFGQIDEGEIAEHTFKVTNTGKLPLVIDSAKSSCSCTVPEYPSYPIPPGESAEITIKFDSNKRTGPIQKAVVLYNNSSPNFRSILKIKGLVVPKK